MNWKRLLRWPRKDGMPAAVLELLRSIYGGRMSSAGKNVSWKTALEVSAVLACASVLARGVAQVPFKVYRKAPGSRERLPAPEHPLYRVLHRRPNPWQTSYEFRHTAMLHLVLTGNAFAFINRVNGVIVELIQLEPGDVTVKRESDYSLVYHVRGKSGASKPFPAESIWHLRGASWCPWLGLDIVQLARNAIGLAMATEEHHAKLHQNGAKPGGLITVEGTLDEKRYAQLRDWLDKEHNGSENAFKTMILDKNAKWLTTALTGIDAQHLETRRYQVEEVCRMLGVMPVMVGHADKALSYASAEQLFLAHVVHALSPWYVCIEQSADASLLTDADELKGYYAKHTVQGLLRGAMKDTADFLTKLSTAGIITRNEAREWLELNPIDGLDEPLTPMNMTIGAGDGADDDKPKSET